MQSPLILYFAPATPVITRFFMCAYWHKFMSDSLPEAAQERDFQRSFIFSLAGFSFTAIAGLAVLDSTIRVGLQLPTWYVLLSFIAFFIALNIQSYKSTRWHNQLANSFIETGTLSLMLALSALLFTTTFSCVFQWIGTSLSIGAWLIDHLVRLRMDCRYFWGRRRALEETLKDQS